MAMHNVKTKCLSQLLGNLITAGRKHFGSDTNKLTEKTMSLFTETDSQVMCAT